MGNQQAGGSRNSRKSSLTASQQLSNSRIMKSRLVVEQRPIPTTTEFVQTMTEAEMLIELAGLYQLTKNEFDSYGLISPFNCEPLSTTMPEAGQQFDRAAKRYLGEAREKINRLQNRRRKTLIRDVNVTRELDELISIGVPKDDIRRSFSMNEVQSGSKAGSRSRQDRSEYQESDHEQHILPFQLPSPPQTKLNDPLSIPPSPAPQPQLTPPSAIPNDVLTGLTSPQQHTSSTPVINKESSKESSEQRLALPQGKDHRISPRVDEHISPIESPREQVAVPYNLDGFEELSDDDDEKVSRGSRAIVSKKMSSILEHSREDDEQEIHEAQKTKSKEPTPRRKPSPRTADTNSEHTEIHQLNKKKSGETHTQSTPTLSISPRPHESVSLSSVEQPAQNSITSISVKKIQQKQIPKQSLIGSEQKYNQQMARLDTEIQAAQTELYRFLDESVNFEGILQKYKIAPQRDRSARQCYRKFVMGPVIDLPSPL